MVLVAGHVDVAVITEFIHLDAQGLHRDLDVADDVRYGAALIVGVVALSARHEVVDLRRRPHSRESDLLLNRSEGLPVREVGVETSAAMLALSFRPDGIRFLRLNNMRRQVADTLTLRAGVVGAAPAAGGAAPAPLKAAPRGWYSSQIVPCSSPMLPLRSFSEVF